MKIAHPRSFSTLVLYVLAWLTLLCTLPLIFMGGLVTTTGTGMSVPDWPNTWGYNMFAVPWHMWWGHEAGGVFYEHAHRLKGTVVGFLATCMMIWAHAPGRFFSVRNYTGRLAVVGGLIGLICWAVPFLFADQWKAAGWYTPTVEKNISHLVPGFLSIAAVCLVCWLSRWQEPRLWVRRLTIGLFVFVCIQGLLGGLRVTEVNIVFAMIHACTAQLFFCLCGFAVLATSSWWHVLQQRQRPVLPVSPSRSAAVVTAALFALLLGQLIVASVMRHNEAGLAITSFPDTYGTVLPPLTAAGLDAINQQRAWTKDADPVTTFQIWIHFAHRVGAVLITLFMGALLWGLVSNWKRRDSGTWLWPVRYEVLALAGLITVQITLGIFTVLWRKPADIATAHVAVGALCLLVSSLMLSKSLALAWLSTRAGQPAAQPIGVEYPQSSPLPSGI